MTEEPRDDGATAAGLYLLGEDYLKAAQAVAALPRQMNAGPIRLLCLHACELFLKAMLRKRGYTHDQLAKLMHDLPEIAEHVGQVGFMIPEDIRHGLATVQETRAYVTSRYHAGRDPAGPFTSRNAVIELALHVQRIARQEFPL